MAFVSITRMRIRSVRFLPLFLLDTYRAQRQVARADGFLGGALLADRKHTYWTMTLWRDMPAMRAYMTTGAHLRAMPRLLHWCDEASVVHWSDANELPDWEAADRRMRAEGRASKVRHPSPSHATLDYDPPRTVGSVTLRPVRRA